MGVCPSGLFVYVGFCPTLVIFGANLKQKLMVGNEVSDFDQTTVGPVREILVLIAFAQKLFLKRPY